MFGLRYLLQIAMGADGFLAYDGADGWTDDENEIDLLESRNDPRIVAARASTRRCESHSIGAPSRRLDW